MLRQGNLQNKIGNEDTVSIPERVLIVSSAPWHEVLSTASMIREHFDPTPSLRFVLSSRQVLLKEHLDRESEDQILCPRELWRMVRAAVALRRSGVDKTVVLFAGEPSYRRLKLFSVLVGFPRLLIFNECQDYFEISLGKLLRHVRWRLREALQRRIHLAVSALNVIREQGWATAWKRLWSRLSTTLPGQSWHLLQTRLTSIYQPRFKLRTDSDPKVSIIIPAFNRWGFTYRCLRSVARHTSVPYEVILADDASTDRTRRAESIVENLRVVRQPTNQGFVKNCNAGAQVARGQWILFLNNDIVVTPKWLELLCEIPETDPSCGAVGAKLLYPNGVLQEAGGILWRGCGAWNYGKFDHPEKPEYSYRRRVDYCSGAALMVRRMDFNDIGGFDSRYAPGYWEDADLCMALRDRGKHVWFQPRCEVYHFEGATSGTSVSKGMKRFQETNRDKFCAKWKEALEQHIAFDPDHLFLARDRNRSPVIMVFDHYVPTFDRDAGSAFLDHFLHVLANLGYRVLLWPDNLYRAPIYTERLQDTGIEVLYGPLSWQNYLESHGRFIDYAIAYRAPMAIKYLPGFTPFEIKLGYIAVDLEHVREDRRKAVEGRIEEEESTDLFRREQEIIDLVDVVGVHSTVEQRIIQDELGAREVHHLPLPVGHAVSCTETPGFAERTGLIFVGSTHPPNVDGLRYFVRRVWPKVRQRLGNARLQVVGDVCNTVRDLQNEPGIDLLGYVKELKAVLDKRRVFVAPLRYGAGVKGKILEAMNHGLPVVTTATGAEGIGIVPGTHALIADTDEDFACSIESLYTDPEHWERMRAASLHLVQERHSPDTIKTAVQGFMNSLTTEQTRPGRAAQVAGSAAAKARG